MKGGIFGLQRQTELRRKFHIFQRAVHRQAGIRIGLHRRFVLALELFGEFAGNGFQQVFHGDHAQNRAEFVHHQSVIRAVFAEQFDGHQRGGAFGQHERLFQSSLHIPIARFQHVGQQIFFVDIAQRFVHAGLAHHQQAGIWALDEFGLLLVLALRNIQPLNVAARNHHAKNGAFGQRQHAAYHGFFVFFKMRVVGRCAAVARQQAFAYAHHAQHVFGGALPPRTADIVIFLGIFLRNLIEHLNQNGESDGGI